MRIEIEILAKKIVEKLKSNNMHVSTVESCTGGGLASSIIDISGASAVINEAYVTYSNEAKIKNIGVDKTLIDKFGVVSKEVAKDMAIKLKNKTKCDVAISTTGNLGPMTLENKDVGLVYIGYAKNDIVDAYECKFVGDRIEIKEEVIYKALDILYNII